MKKLLVLFMPLLLISCGGEDEKNGKSGTVDFSEYGLDATIETGGHKEINVRDLTTNYELTLLEKSIEIECGDGLVVVVQQAQKNGVKNTLDFAESFGDRVIESADNHYLIETTRQNEKMFNCSYFFEKDGAVIEVRIADEELFMYAKSEDQARKGMEIAKTFKFK